MLHVFLGNAISRVCAQLPTPEFLGRGKLALHNLYGPKTVPKHRSCWNPSWGCAAASLHAEGNREGVPLARAGLALQLLGRTRSKSTRNQELLRPMSLSGHRGTDRGHLTFAAAGQPLPTER